jgi:hypothetical protein
MNFNVARYQFLTGVELGAIFASYAEGCHNGRTGPEIALEDFADIDLRRPRRHFDALVGRGFVGFA